ncbi:MAG: IS66 family insertion sequence element accessory protein TnpB [Mycoplasmatota bacterium]
MLEHMLKDIDEIYIAYGYTDFRKQTYSLANLVTSKYKAELYKSAAFIFCNKHRTAIKVLCYDKNGFVLAQKTLLNADKMKFQWPRNEDELKIITYNQLKWLLTGLTMYPKKQFNEYKI